VSGLGSREAEDGDGTAGVGRVHVYAFTGFVGSFARYPFIVFGTMNGK